MINDALVAWIQQRSVLDAAKRAVREELTSCGILPKGATRGVRAASGRK